MGLVVSMSSVARSRFRSLLWAACLWLTLLVAVLPADAVPGRILGGTDNEVLTSPDGIVGAGKANRLLCFDESAVVAGQSNLVWSGQCAEQPFRGPPPPPVVVNGTAVNWPPGPPYFVKGTTRFGPCGDPADYNFNINSASMTLPSSFPTCWVHVHVPTRSYDSLVGGGFANVVSRASFSAIATGSANHLVYQDIAVGWWVPALPCGASQGPPQPMDGIAIGFCDAQGHLLVKRYAADSAILGGSDNLLTGAESAIASGRGNRIDAAAAFQNAATVGGRGNSLTFGYSPGGPPVPTTWPAPGSLRAPDHSVIGGGMLNGAAARDAFVGAGIGNGAPWNASVLAGQGNAPVSTSNGFVGAGLGNGALPSTAWVAAGTLNFAPGGAIISGSEGTAGLRSLVGAGRTNTAPATNAAVAGGSVNIVLADRTVVVGGEYNTAWNGRPPWRAATDSAILGGASGRVLGVHSFVGGGVQGNQARNESSGVIGGSGAIVDGWFAAALGGNAHEATGRSGAVFGGNVTRAGAFAATLGGLLNDGQGTGAFIGGGFGNKVPVGSGVNPLTGLGTVAGGRDNHILAPHGNVAGGWGAVTTLAGQAGLGSGEFAAAGDAQASHVVLKAYSPAGGDVEMTTATGAQLVVPDNTTWAFEGLVVARDVFGMSHGWTFKGSVKRVAGLVQVTPTPIVIQAVSFDQNAAGWRVTATLDTAHGALRIAGWSATPVRFVADVSMVQVAHA